MSSINQLKDISLLGICGREGAGKTTITNILKNDINYIINKETNCTPLDYIIDVIFGTDDLLNNNKDPIWNLTRLEQYQIISDLISKHVDSEWLARHNHAPFLIPYDCFEQTKWVEFSFATALKKICSVLFKIPYAILLAQTEYDRKAREENLYGHGFNKLPDGKPMNGRNILEYFGTDVMRNCFDQSVWIKIVERESAYFIKQGLKVVFPDVRFENEVDMINNIGGTLLLVYRKDEDLILTEEDRKTHPAKWHFLQYYSKAKKLIKFQNNIPLEDLQFLIRNIVYLK